MINKEKVFYNLAATIPKIKKLVNNGWNIFYIDTAFCTIGLDKEVIIKLTSGKTKKKRKIKNIKLTKKECKYINEIANVLTFFPNIDLNTFTFEMFEE